MNSVVSVTKRYKKGIMLSEKELLTIKMSLMVAIDSHRETIVQRNRIIENTYRVGSEEEKLYKNANKITQGWIEDAQNAIIAVNNLLKDRIYG